MILFDLAEGFDQVMERMMEAAGQHNHPPPASDTVIEGLPRVKLDSQTLGERTTSDRSAGVFVLIKITNGLRRIDTGDELIL